MQGSIPFGIYTAQDGVRLAYATMGSGPPLLETANWMNHLEYDWKSPIWQPLASELARRYTLVRYDQRGNGLSDWQVPEFSFAAFVSDLEAVVSAVGLERFSLLGISQGCAVAIEYAARHPERVDKLVLYGGYARGWRSRSAEEVEAREAMVTLIRRGWGQDNPAFRQLFSSLFMPEASAEQFQHVNELQRVSCSPENAARIVQAAADIDVTGRMELVRAPTLVLHCTEDARASPRAACWPRASRARASWRWRARTTCCSRKSRRGSAFHPRSRTSSRAIERGWPRAARACSLPRPWSRHRRYRPRFSLRRRGFGWFIHPPAPPPRHAADWTAARQAVRRRTEPCAKKRNGAVPAMR